MKVLSLIRFSHQISEKEPVESLGLVSLMVSVITIFSFKKLTIFLVIALCKMMTIF